MSLYQTFMGLKEKSMEYRRQTRVGVIGGAHPKAEFREAALVIGRMIARGGAILVCGGLGGVMEAAAKGVSEEGGLSIGILPGNSPEDANPYIDIPVATAMGYSRNMLVVINSDVLIAVDGEYGTLSEIAYGRVYGKRIIGLGTWDIPGVIKAISPEEAVRLALGD
jgi:uncharacterized protein (TIGR00725 family)